MSADSAVTYTSVHSEARSWSIPSEDPYEEAARQLLEQAPRSPEYVPDPMELEDHVPVYILEPEHPEDLVPAEDEAPTPLLPPFFFIPTDPPLLPILLPAPSTSRGADIPEAGGDNGASEEVSTYLLLGPVVRLGRSSAVLAVRQPGPTMAHRVDYSLVDTMETRFRDTERRMMTALEMVNMRDRAAVRAEIEILRRERLTYEKESIQTCQDLARSEAYCRALEARVTVLDTEEDDDRLRDGQHEGQLPVLKRERLAYEQESIQARQDLARSEAYSRALEARVTVLETEVRRHEWQRQAADDVAVQYIMRTQALEAGARVDTLEDTGSSS
ncbi:hypothetical protein Tco_1237896 [Tanacetum coccineum]